MANDGDKSDFLEPEESSETSSDEAKQSYEKPEVEVSRGVEPLPLEDVDFGSLNLPDRSQEPEEEEKNTYEMEVEPESDYVKSLDNCPNCGKSMGKIGNVVCMNCGFDLKSMSVIDIKKGAVTEEQLKEEKRIPDLISPRGKGGMVLPLIMAGAALFILLIGYLVRSPWLFENESQNRFVALMIGIGWLIPIYGSGLGAVYVLGILLERKVGRFKRVAARVAGIVCTMRLATFIDSPYGEFVIEMLLEGGVAFVAALFFFKLKPRDACLLVLLGSAIFLLFYFVVWLFGQVM